MGEIILLTVFGVYGIFLIAMILVFAPASPGERGRLKGLSIVIPFRNEKENLPVLLRELRRLRGFPEQIEVILVDDHSDDGYFPDLEETESLSFRLFPLPEGLHGKKAAIDLGVRESSGEWILTLDADVQPGHGFREILLTALPENKQAMITAIRPARRKGLSSVFFDLEFLVLQVFTLGMARMKIPLLSNGACFLFRKEAYFETRVLRGDWDLNTGDDIFLLNAIRKRYGSRSIGIIHPAEPVVTAGFPEDFRTLFLQRLRWISKTSRVPNLIYSLFAWGIFLVHVGFYPFLFYSFTKDFSYTELAALKFIPEFCLLLIAALRFKRSDLIVHIPVAQVLYPLYLIALVGFGLWGGIKSEETYVSA
jgi:cellulose synthase/poly-beta-1,6-N-acetylglucosamine synthase-like glycosyltransferase